MVATHAGRTTEILRHGSRSSTFEMWTSTVGIPMPAMASWRAYEVWV